MAGSRSWSRLRFPVPPPGRHKRRLDGDTRNRGNPSWPLALALGGNARQELLGLWQDALHDTRYPLRIGMQPVAEGERLVESDSLQEERVKHEVVTGGEIAIERAERIHIWLAHIARRFHAGEQDRKPSGLHFGD